MRFLIATFLFSLLTLSAFAQDESSALSCRFLTVGKAKVPDFSHPGADGSLLSIEVFSNRMSKAYECQPVDGRLRFTSSDGESLFAEAAVPANTDKAIIVVLPMPGANGPQWKMKVIADNDETFPVAGAYVLNLHNGPIRFALGEHQAGLAPGDARGFSQPEKRDDFNMAPLIFQFQNTQKEWRTGKETMLKFTPGLRYLVFAYVDARIKRPQVQIIKVLS
ncbi:hypothetical protein [Roseibacillus ishigakijimensis]|uniref:Uncharacterized protein n=1 Tax=Roseibacillus ishigakijimensis TaxID=454146 RepID=A0A934VN88_9BACT|nr:hypothetical protein [Roseibacillus ishigakijimensis]MBK1834770.1 hypothetical protein [Roseibacillus ishigakijimensis]